jgi:PHD/YefM family antitoxin component YafN of YafNO toxin-antitoxin module
MSNPTPVVTSAVDLVRQFSLYSDLVFVQPVVITRNSRPRNVLLSFEEYERLKKRDQQVFVAADTPEKFIGGIEALARETE